MWIACIVYMCCPCIEKINLQKNFLTVLIPPSVEPHPKVGSVKKIVWIFFKIYFPSGWKVCGESRFHHNPWMQVGFFIFSELKTLAGEQLDLCVICHLRICMVQIKAHENPKQLQLNQTYDAFWLNFAFAGLKAIQDLLFHGERRWQRNDNSMSCWFGWWHRWWCMDLNDNVWI